MVSPLRPSPALKQLLRQPSSQRAALGVPSPRSSPSPSPLLRPLSRSYASQRLPLFNYKVPYGDSPVPTVEYLTDPDEADEHLETLRSKRLTLTSDYAYHRNGPGPMKKYAAGNLAVLCLADADGILILHIARMKHPPSLLKPILENMEIQKQGAASPFTLNAFRREAPRWDYMRPNAFLDTRLMAFALYPEMFTQDLRRRPVADFLEIACANLLGMGFTGSMQGQFEFQSSLEGMPGLTYLANEIWIEHLLGLVLHETLRLKVMEVVGQGLAPLDQAEAIREGLMERWIYHYLDFELDAEN